MVQPGRLSLLESHKARDTDAVSAALSHASLRFVGAVRAPALPWNVWHVKIGIHFHVAVANDH